MINAKPEIGSIYPSTPLKPVPAFLTNAWTSRGKVPAENTSNRLSLAQTTFSPPSYSLTVLIVSPTDKVGEGGTREIANREGRMEGVGGVIDSEKSDGGALELLADIGTESRGRVGPLLGVRRDEGELNIPPGL